MAGMIDFKRPDGGTCKGYLAEAGTGKPAIVVIQEWWGLNDQIKGVADRFAKAGYNALAPDLYKGRVTQKPDEANHMMSGLDFVGASDQDIAGAVKHLARLGGRKVGVMGYCMGGALTIAAAARVPGIACGVPYYGVPPQQLADPAKIGIPIQGHFANKDDWCTPQLVNDFEKAMTAGGHKPEIFRYDAAHAFANERSPAYDATAAKQAWDRTMAFLGKHL
jgi:carboxymethylenebutenolidase